MRPAAHTPPGDADRVGASGDTPLGGPVHEGTSSDGHGPSSTSADDGMQFCATEQLLLARIADLLAGSPASASTESPASPVDVPRRYVSLATESMAVMSLRHREERWRVARRRVRRLCEDMDECLGQAGAALSEGRRRHARRLLSSVRGRLDVIMRATGDLPSPDGGEPVRPIEAGDGVPAALTLLTDLDAELGDAAAGYRGAGWRARRCALLLLAVVDDLMAAAQPGEHDVEEVGMIDDLRMAAAAGAGPRRREGRHGRTSSHPRRTGASRAADLSGRKPSSGTTVGRGSSVA
jgi:hypothetical protein